MDRRKLTPKLDRFAELLSQDLSFLQVRERMNITNSQYQSYYSRLCRDLGVPLRDQ